MHVIKHTCIISWIVSFLTAQHVWCDTSEGRATRDQTEPHARCRLRCCSAAVLQRKRSISFRWSNQKHKCLPGRVLQVHQVVVGSIDPDGL